MISFGSRRAVTAAAAIVGTAAAYLAWLGWDQSYDLQPDGSLTGPYQAWQVLGLVLTLSALTVACSARRASVVGALLITLTVTACFAIDAATDAESDGLWPIGAALALIGTGFGTSLVAALATAAINSRSSSGRSGASAGS